MLPWLVVPGLLVALAAILLTIRVSSTERDHVAAVVQESQRGQVVPLALSAMEYEVYDLVALDAFTNMPPEFAAYAASADALREAGRDVVLTTLSSAEPTGSQKADELVRVYDQVPRAVLDVLHPLPAQIMGRLQQGDEAFVDPKPYVEAIRWCLHEIETTSTHSADTTRALLDLGSRSAYWHSAEFEVLAGALVLLAVVGGLFGVWRLSAATRRLSDEQAAANAEAVRMAGRVDQLRTVIASSRQMSATADPVLVARHLVDEGARLFAADLVVLSLLQDGMLTPVATSQRVGAGSVAMHDGIVGRCAEGGVPLRMVVAADPLLPGLQGPLSLLAVPLVRDGRVEGVLTIGRKGSELFDQGDETVLGLVALMGSGALGVAERVGTTLALALDDPLTGLGNRRRLDRDLGSLQALAADSPTAFLMIDIDHFKRFNDQYGHPAGDDLLRRVGDAIRRSLRVGDIAYRFGGEEFSVLLPGADLATAQGIAERVRASVSSLLPPPGGSAVTVSVGVSLGERSTPTSAMVQAADQALYCAKRTGRDRVVVA